VDVHALIRKLQLKRGHDIVNGPPFTGELDDLWEFNPATKEWTWVAGSNTAGQYQPPVYGTLGTPSDQNTPGSRFQAVSWIDRSDNLWLFGGPDSNDLWEFNLNTNQWVWVGGSDNTIVGVDGTPGSVGVMGVPSPTNIPAGRDSAVGWTDKNGNFWLFGGQAGPFYNDLWRYQP
jgi:hypothetical protein